MSESWTILECPGCNSKRAAIVASHPPSARCTDCGTFYPIKSEPDPNAINPLKLGRGKGKKQRTAAPGIRHRQDNGPEELNVEIVSAPTPQELGTAHLFTHEVLSGGPRALIAAQHEAARLSQKFGEEIEAKWCLSTKWLLKLSERHRARAQYAMMWRPRFLAIVAMTRSASLGCRGARVSQVTVDKHRAEDEDFNRQVLAAQEHAVNLLHDVTMREAIEGHCEPIYWQGIRCGNIIKVDNRLRIEMLRAHLPAVFKTPGSGSAAVPVPPGSSVLIVTPEVQAELMAMRQEGLRALQEKKAKAIEVESVTN